MKTFAEVLKTKDTSSEINRTMYEIGNAVSKFFDVEDVNFNSVCRLVLQTRKEDYENQFSYADIAEEINIIRNKFSVKVLLNFDGDDLYDEMIEKRSED
jgi:hypothetical protein